MTQEEKAQAYDEALGRAKDYYKANQKIGEMEENNMLSDIFPELAESEDEKIRKEIITYLSIIEDRDLVPLDDWLAWLEKQKEYESTDFEYVWDRTDCGELTSALDKYSEEAIINMCHAWYDKGIELERKSWLEKQGDNPIKWNKNTKDCKPKVSHSVLMKTTHGIAEGEWQGEHWHQYRWSSIVRDSDVLSWIELSELEKQGEQKIVDKIEPKFKVGDIVVVKPMACHGKIIKGEPFKIVDIAENNYISDNGKSYSISLQDGWELIGQKQEWSEEDECLRRRCIGAIEMANLSDYTKDELLNWLKSLKPQNKWKPSDAQMDSITCAVWKMKESACYDSELVSLLNDLKKLK